MLDTPARYGPVTRALHGLTAFLVLWQFTMVSLYKIFGESPGLNSVARFGPHGYVGLAVLFLALARIGWALGNRGRRPAPAGRLATVAHRTMYALMVFIPSVAVARVWAKGEGWTIAGVELFAATAITVPSVIAVADWLHGPLSWVLLALIGLHSAAAATHGLVWRDGLSARMFGRPVRA